MVLQLTHPQTRTTPEPSVISTQPSCCFFCIFYFFLYLQQFIYCNIKIEDIQDTLAWKENSEILDTKWNLALGTLHCSVTV